MRTTSRKLVPVFGAVLLSTVLVLGGTAAIAGGPNFVISVSSDGDEIGAFNYVRNLPSGAHWLDGDRVGYSCAYMFLEYQNQIVGRVTFIRVEGSEAYARINDQFMEEGARYYDGTPNPDPNVQQLNAPECNNHPPYSAPAGDPGALPVINFTSTNGTVLEVRNYANVPAGAGAQFRIVSATTDRVTVIVYRNGQAVSAVYYDRLSDAITLTSNAPVQPPPPPVPPPPPPEPSPPPGPGPAGRIVVPNLVDQGKQLKVKVFGCGSGDGFSAIVRTKLFNKHDLRVALREKAADVDGTTTVKVKIRANAYPPGRYQAFVTCLHVFTAGGQSASFVEHEGFRVRKAAAGG